MNDPHATDHHSDAGVKPYLIIFVALVIFTTVSFAVNGLVRKESLTRETGFTLILGVAVCKAVLVAMYFMHLRLDWRRLYFMIIPVMILGTMMVVVLLPDIVLAWRH